MLAKVVGISVAVVGKYQFPMSFLREGARQAEYLKKSREAGVHAAADVNSARRCFRLEIHLNISGGKSVGDAGKANRFARRLSVLLITSMRGKEEPAKCKYRPDKNRKRKVCTYRWVRVATTEIEGNADKDK